MGLPRIPIMDATQHVVLNEGRRRIRLGHITSRAREVLLQLGHTIAEGTEQIITLEIGVEAETLAWANNS